MFSLPKKKKEMSRYCMATRVQFIKGKFLSDLTHLCLRTVGCAISNVQKERNLTIRKIGQ